jgi:hypothetical protein
VENSGCLFSSFVLRGGALDDAVEMWIGPSRSIMAYWDYPESCAGALMGALFDDHLPWKDAQDLPEVEQWFLK